MEDVFENLNEFLNDKKVTTILSVLIIFYASVIAPSLPNSVIVFFDNSFGKLVLLFVVAYLASQNTQVAILVSIAFFLTLYYMNRRENFRNNNNKINTKDEAKVPELPSPKFTAPNLTQQHSHQPLPEHMTPQLNEGFANYNLL
tara:strand:- start:332 stop:763 length:432 start_codon:yes stop_codon:yes gene_type:complete